jgi:ABC-type uncharacterized transport system ATPase subunit
VTEQRRKPRGWSRRAIGAACLAIVLGLAPGASSSDLLEAATSRGFALRRFETRKPSLHDVFLHLVGDEAATKTGDSK